MAVVVAGFRDAADVVVGYWFSFGCRSSGSIHVSQFKKRDVR